MQHIPLADRTQLEFTSLEGMITQDNTVLTRIFFTPQKFAA